MYARLTNAAGRHVHTTRDVMPWRVTWYGRALYPPLLRYGGILFADTGRYTDVATVKFRHYREVPDHGGPLDR